MWVVTAASMRALEARWLDQTGLPEAVLMERAADAVWRRLATLAPAGAAIVVFAGPGHNGGDGLAVARMALGAEREVTVVLAADRGRLRPLTTAQLAAYEGLGGRVVDLEQAREVLGRAAVAVDAMLGTGITSGVRGPIAAAIDALDGFTRPVLAVDVPSGVCSDTGRVLGAAVTATHTVTFHGLRWGHVVGPGLDRSGAVEVADLGIPQGWEPPGVTARVCDRPRSIARAPRTAYKGSRGHLLLVAGSEAYRGAAVLAAQGAFAGGAGLVTVAGPAWVQDAVLAALPEAITASVDHVLADPSRYDALVIGPGLGRESAAHDTARRVIAAFADRPVVVDADAIALIGDAAPGQVRRSLAITPHVGELARWLGRATEAVTDDFATAVVDAQRRLGGVVVAKTAGALVADAAGLRMVLPQSSAIGTAGAGDALAGLLGALAMQMPLGLAAETAVWVQQRAGAVLANGSTRGVRASALAGAFAGVLGELEHGA